LILVKSHHQTQQKCLMKDHLFFFYKYIILEKGKKDAFSTSVYIVYNDGF